jgi:hypothetical protein
MTVYALIDNATHNILGEFPSLSQAQDLLQRLVDADPSVANDLVIKTVTGTSAPDETTYVTVA